MDCYACCVHLAVSPNTAIHIFNLTFCMLVHLMGLFGGGGICSTEMQFILFINI